MANYSDNAHWRDSARVARFVVAVVAMFFFSLLGRYGFTVPVFLRWLRTMLAGPRKFAIPWWKA